MGKRPVHFQGHHLQQVAASGQSTEGAAASAVCDRHGKHHQHAAAGNKIPNKLLEERLNAKVMMEVGTSLLITERVGCPGKQSGQDSSSIFVLYNQTFLSLPRNLPVSLTSCMERITHWNKIMAATTIPMLKNKQGQGTRC